MVRGFLKGVNMGSGGGSVGRAVTSSNSGTWFKSNLLSSVVLKR